jgi:formate dehydrogenase iron-sulfur subunit
MNAILVDVTRCTGCERCVAACVETNGLDAKRAWVDRATTRDGLSANRPLSILEVEDGRFARLSCMHCLEPSCVSACLVGGITKTPEGPVIYDPDRCIGCRYCMLACPFGVPRYEWNSINPKVQKCTMCSDRVLAGNPTACTEACPTGATKFGERDQLLAEARQRIKDNPGNYVDHIYGEQEVGGTSVLLLSSVPFEDFGYRTDFPHDPLPNRTFAVQSRIPDFVPLWGSLLGGIWWITHRREEVANAEGKEKGGTK